MTNTKMLEILNSVISDIQNNTTPELAKLMMYRKTIEQDIRTESCLTKSDVNLQKSCEKVIKSAEKNHLIPQFHGSWIINGKQYVCNKYIGFRISNPIPLKEVEVCKSDYFEMDKIMTEEWVKSCNQPLFLPLKSWVKANMKSASTSRLNPTVVYDFNSTAVLEHNYPIVNLEYLSWIMNGIENVSAYWNGNPNSPIYFKSEDTSLFGFSSNFVEAILMPINRETYMKSIST